MHKLILTSAAVLSLAACNQGADSSAPAEEAEASAADAATEPQIAEPAQPSGQPAVETAETIEGITNQRVSFAPGSNSATVEGTITGYEIVDYLLKVGAGQPMNVSMATQSTAAYFNILEPGETEVAMHIGSTSGNQYEGVTTKSGDYRIRVYQMRSAARRDEKASYRLEMIVG